MGDCLRIGCILSTFALFACGKSACASGQEANARSTPADGAPSAKTSASSESPQSSGADDWRKPLILARGPAERGPWRMNESHFHYVDDPTVVVDSEGAVLVAWVDNQAQNVKFQRLDAGGKPQAKPLDVSRSPETFSWSWLETTGTTAV